MKYYVGNSTKKKRAAPKLKAALVSGHVRRRAGTEAGSCHMRITTYFVIPVIGSADKEPASRGERWPGYARADSSGFPDVRQRR